MSEEIERGLLGTLIMRPGLIEEADLRDYDFPAGRLRQTFSTIADIWEETRAAEVDAAILAHRLGGNGSVEFVGNLLDARMIKLDPDAFRVRVEELRRRTAWQRIRSKLHERENEPDPDLEDLRPDLEALLRPRESSIDPARFLKTGAELQALDIKVEWTIDKLQPARSLTLLHSRGGLGKTWLELGASKAVSTGVPFLGLATTKRPVYYIDFENPLPLLVERVRKLEIRDVIFWTLCATTPPPKLDSADWTLYAKVLPPGSMVVFDTLRAAHDGDENSSQDAAVVMGRLKQLRETGLDIIALHHTNKADDRAFKGSTAWADLADHVLDFHQHRRRDLKEADDEDLDPQDALFSLGTGSKTRFAPFRTFLSFDPETGAFSLAEDPKTTLLGQLAEYIAGEGLGKNQTEVVAWAKDALGIKKRDAILAMLRRGEGSRWKTSRGFRNGVIYEPL